MENSLMSYMSKRLIESNNLGKGAPAPGPVITISREVGCNGIKLAEQIAARLNGTYPIKKWKVLSKEIFYESAKELNLDYERISKVFKQTDKYTFEEILKAFGDRQYKSERRIIKTVVDVIHSFAVEGYCIIVGRAGHVIASDIKNALHLRLFAPLEYRVKTIMENNGLKHDEAIAFINRVENERIAFRKALHENELREYLFDLTINRAIFSTNDIVDMIEMAASKKNLALHPAESLFAVY